MLTTWTWAHFMNNISNRNSSSMKIQFCCLSRWSEVIAIKFCTWHNSNHVILDCIITVPYCTLAFIKCYDHLIYLMEIFILVGQDLYIETGPRFRDQPSQWEMSLQCNDISHWLGAYLDRSKVSWPLFTKQEDVLHWNSQSFEAARCGLRVMFVFFIFFYRVIWLL